MILRKWRSDGFLAHSFRGCANFYIDTFEQMCYIININRTSVLLTVAAYIYVLVFGYVISFVFPE